MKKFDKQFAVEILKYALWLGLITGLVEGVLLYALQRYELLRGQITYLGSGPQVLWVAPVFDALFFLLVGVGVAVVAQFLPRKFARQAVFFVFCFLMIFGWLLVYLSGRLNPAATAILGAGIGYQIAMLIVARENRFSKFTQQTFKILAGVTLALFVLIQGGFWIRERVATS
ncbi:MAG: hypothetical protein IT315_08040, partial [Anaerolineales bacterium]|nr:hypothetical protein [Anaerolineales bacterium]